MLFDFAKTSKVLHPEVRTIIRKLRSSQNSAVSLLKIGVFILPKGKYARSPLASLPVGVEPPCRAMKTAIFWLSARKPGDDILPFQRFQFSCNYLELNDLSNFIAKNLRLACHLI